MYIPKNSNIIQQIFKNHFNEFENVYEDKYADEYGSFNIIRIKKVAERFMVCGDWDEGIARIQCTNKECGNEIFRPFSCKGFYLCPSCHQKRLLLLSEHLVNNVLIRYPHRQFVFTLNLLRAIGLGD